jgi:hypothetical protein
MAYNTTTWSDDVLTAASETSSETLNNATLSGTLTVSGATQLSSTLTVGVDDTGYDVKFFGATSGKYMLWDESADSLVLTATSKLYFDGGGNTYMHEASADQIEVVAGGTTMLYIDNQGGSGEDEVRIPTNTKFRIGGADTYFIENPDDNLQLIVGSREMMLWDQDETAGGYGTISCGVDNEGVDFKLFGETSGSYMLWDQSADRLILAGGATLSVDSIKDSNGDSRIVMDPSANTVEVRNASFLIQNVDNESPYPILKSDPDNNLHSLSLGGTGFGTDVLQIGRDDGDHAISIRGVTTVHDELIAARLAVTNLTDDASIPITAACINIDANGGARTGIRFADTGVAGQIIIVNNTGGEKLTFHGTEGTALVRGIHADHDVMDTLGVYVFISDGALWNYIGGGVDSQPDLGMIAS